jgi:hypothetical protein
MEPFVMPTQSSAAHKCGYIPYMGSKNKLAAKIYDAIRADSRVYKGELVDLFCGGFAVSAYFMQHGWSVLANDANKYVIALLEQTLGSRLPTEGEYSVYKWVSRALFKDVLANLDNYPDWYVGYVLCVWSFGNKQTSYLFGKDIEPLKKIAHEIVTGATVRDRRLTLYNFVRNFSAGRFDLQQLERLEQLERLQQLKRLEQLELSSLEYRAVRLPKGSIIYCDPPYENKAGYYMGAFNSSDFWQWVRDTSQTHKIYVSSYVAPPDFKTVASFAHHSSLGTSSNVATTECLFTWPSNSEAA